MQEGNKIHLVAQDEGTREDPFNKILFESVFLLASFDCKDRSLRLLPRRAAQRARGCSVPTLSVNGKATIYQGFTSSIQVPGL